MLMLRLKNLELSYDIIKYRDNTNIIQVLVLNYLLQHLIDVLKKVGLSINFKRFEATIKYLYLQKTY